ncbi:MAG: S1 RNA-binding domain-containing protein [Patescibacteria group bacterium]|nr:S1 RNA-binding domain-containing protein [Patescibacteria group bacterium]
MEIDASDNVDVLKNQDDFLKPAKIGDILKGTIIGIGRSSVFVDLGILGTGIIYGKEFYESKTELEDLIKGDSVSSKVVAIENEDGYVELSLSKASKELVWKELVEKKESKEDIKVKILGVNKGGLLTKYKGVPAFLPASQLSSSHSFQLSISRAHDQSEILKEFQKFIGQEIEVKVFEVIPKDKKLILSEKAKEIENIGEFLVKFKQGDIIEGTISKIVAFGAFIRFPVPQENKEDEEDLKMIEGLIHISEFDWQVVEDPNKFLKVNQKIKAQIIKIEDSRIFLSLKSLKKNVWEDVEKKYKIGDKIKGKVVKVNAFGAFILLPIEIQGLCHISEFETKKEMTEKMEIGKTYEFEIIALSAKDYKIGLHPLIK